MTNLCTFDTTVYIYIILLCYGGVSPVKSIRRPVTNFAHHYQIGTIHLRRCQWSQLADQWQINHDYLALKKKVNGVNDQCDFALIHMRKQGQVHRAGGEQMRRYGAPSLVMSSQLQVWGFFWCHVFKKARGQDPALTSLASA